MQKDQYHEQQRRQTSTSLLDSLADPNEAPNLPLVATIHPAYEDRQSMVVGIILIIAGVFSIFITILGIGIYNIFSFLSHGIWFGVVVSKSRCSFTQNSILYFLRQKASKFLGKSRTIQSYHHHYAEEDDFLFVLS